jgi:Xylose isomerase-like TIM barrel
MRLAVSNLMFPAFDHLPLLSYLPDYGVMGLEVSPLHAFRGAAGGIAAADVEAYRRGVTRAGLRVVGLHGLTASPLVVDDLALGVARHAALGWLEHMSAVCRDLGGQTLVLTARTRRELREQAALLVLRDFIEELLPRIEVHGTILALAPLCNDEGNVCASPRACHVLASALDHGSFALNLRAAAVSEGGKVDHVTFAQARGKVLIYHADEPGLVPLGSSGTVDHTGLRLHLEGIAYRGYVSVVQRPRPEDVTPVLLARTLGLAKDAYFPPGKASEEWRRARPLRGQGPVEPAR